MNEIVNTHTAFEPLKKTWVGKCYPPEFFDYITNKEARQCRGSRRFTAN